MASLLGVFRKTRPELDVPASLEAALAATIERARLAWPDVQLDDAAFVRAIAERVDERGQLDALLTDDLYLACACAAGDRGALATFDRACVPVMERAASAAGARSDEVADVCQVVRQRLLVATMTEAGEEPPRIASYSARGGLTAWLRVVATRETARLLPRTRREPAADDAELAQILANDDDPELGYLKRLYRDEFKQAFAAALAALSDRDRLLLQQHVLDRLGIDHLAKLHGVHRATAARWLEAMRAALLDGTRRELVRRLQVSRDELDSIMRLIGGHVDELTLSLQRLLKTP